MAILNHHKLGNLIKKSLNGDEQAFQRFYECTAKYQYYRILQMIGNPSDANDALQETYLLLYQRLNRIGDPASAVAYLNKLAYHVCLNQSRVTNRRERRISGLDILDELPDRKDDPQELLLNADSSNEIQQAIQELPAQERLVLVLRYVQKLTLKETADIMNVSFSKVRRLQQSAKELLKEDLDRKGLFALIPILPTVGRSMAQMIEKQITVPAFSNGSFHGHPAAHPPSAHFSSVLAKSALAAAGTGILVSGAVNFTSSPPSIQNVQLPSAYVSDTAFLSVTASGQVPVASCELRYKGETIAGEVRPGNSYVFPLKENGSYTIIAKNNSGKSTEKEVQVNCFDETYPKAEDAQLRDGRFLVKLYDGESGIDEKSVYYLTSAGEKIFPDRIDTGTMTVSFTAKKGENTLYFSDKAGNESEALLNY